MFRPPAEGFARTETIVPPRGSFAPSESKYPSSGGFIPAESIMPLQGGFSPADTHAKFFDDIRGSHYNRHAKDYVAPSGVGKETGNPSDRATQLSSAGKKAAAEMNTVGKCATGVQNALAKAGMPEFKGKFHGWQAREVLLNSGMFEEVPLNQVREGDIVCRKTNPNLRDQNAKYGHVAIVGKNQNGRMMEYSDHAQPFIPNHQRYSQTVVLRLKAQYA